MFKDFQDKYGCIFIHVPKVAGTSIERVIFETDKWLVGHKKAIVYIKQDKNKFYQYFSFGFVRNPYDRMCSAYHYLKNGGAGGNDLEWSKIHLNKYESFRDFVLDLKNENIKNEILKYYHFIPQHEFLCNEQDEIIVNFVGFYENLNSDFEKILNILNMTRTMVWANKSEHNDFRTYYDKETYEIVKNIYLKDFQIFDYDIDPDNHFLNSITNTNYLTTKIKAKNNHISKLMLEEYYKSKQLKEKDILILTKTNIINELEKEIIDKSTIIKDKEKIITNNTQKIEQQKKAILSIEQELEEKEKIILAKTNIINELEKEILNKNTIIKDKEKIISINKQKLQEKENVINSFLEYGTATQRIQSHLAYKLGKCVKNANLLSMPFVVFLVYLNHIIWGGVSKKKRIKLYEYYDYIEALKLKQSYEYKLGELIISSFSNWYKFKIFTLPFDIKKLQKQMINKDKK
ncbi:sulfotransferase family protein [Campylobacter sp. RM5004]|uniref:sulfotransferase family 2 domain-containing protein n=1 Tax=Campylobacter sp. RM5004 TaxID=1660078 RepID=UPI001EFB7DF7|nr:sulfotransferase family 2 domain-containing protein [Campylobacter sp. RM5004]ULO01700.1 sulfotransferase family protein [Campylobacter sp. RM5004]